MGMLAYGAAAGAADEWLKQSEETRQNEFDLIRDKRLSELRMGEETHRQDLIGKRESDSYNRSKNDFSVGYGEDVYRDGEKVASGRDRPVAGGSVEPTQIQLINGDYITEDLLRKQWEGMAFEGRDEFGNPIGRRAEVPEYDEWRNSRVMEKHRINPERPAEPEPDAGPSTEALDQARKEAEDKARWLATDSSDFGPEGREAWIQKRAQEIDAGNKRPGRGGMLSEDTTPKPAATPPAQETKPKQSSSPIVLTQEAKRDPDTMYYELMDATEEDDYSEVEIIQFIQKYFNDPSWDIPKDR